MMGLREIPEADVDRVFKTEKKGRYNAI